ncbi:MAG: hypothetical protein LBR91_00460 [Puniceicoccales bacterium]|jgi:general secretion pathway protein D|nr:hypothetical protein [Puniceicoccales bacterium]
MKNKLLIFIFLVLGLHDLYADDGTFDDRQRDTAMNVSLASAPLSQVLRTLEELTGKSVLRDNSLQEIQISLQTSGGISRNEAISVIESALAINHVAIVELGDGMLKAVSLKSAPSQSPRFVEGSLQKLPPSEKICSKLFQLKFLHVTEFSKLIGKLLNPELSSAIVFEESNSVLITDSISALQRIELILSKVDIPKHSVIDSKIFRIKHGEAKNISDLLNKIIRGQHGKSGAASALGEELLSNSSFRFSKGLTVECDERSNSVVVCGTPSDIEHVESVIGQIDVLLDQVRIEVVIAQVTLAKGQSSGLSNFSFNYNAKDGNKDSKPEGVGTDGKDGGGKHEPSMGTGISGVQGMESPFSVAGNLKNFSLNLVFNKAKTDSNVAVLAAPTIVTTHNRQASVEISESIPIVKSEIMAGAMGATQSSISYKDMGIILIVKPLIGVNGVIQLEISQMIESRTSDVTLNKNTFPLTSKRSAMSFVSVYDGDTVVLAGLQQKETSKTGGKVWLLGDLPVIGNMLFSPKSNSEKVTELVIFIKPTIVSNPTNEGAYAKKMIDGLPEVIKDDIEYYKENGKFLPTPQPEKEEKKSTNSEAAGTVQSWTKVPSTPQLERANKTNLESRKHSDGKSGPVEHQRAPSSATKKIKTIGKQNRPSPRIR